MSGIARELVVRGITEEAVTRLLSLDRPLHERLIEFADCVLATQPDEQAIERGLREFQRWVDSNEAFRRGLSAALERPA